MTEEKKPEKKRQKGYAYKIAHALLKVVLFILLFIVLLFLLLLTPPVQRYATTKVESYLRNKLKTRVEIGSIGFGLSGNVNLNDIYIEDQTKDTLLSGGSLKANVNIGKLFSNEVEIKDVALEDITAKIKRVLPDTVFNFQFIVDAFVTEQTKKPDTAQTAPLKLNVYNIDLRNVRMVLKDAITGNDMVARIGDLTANIDTMNIYTAQYSVPLIMARNVVARINQTKPLVEPEPVSKDVAEASQPIMFKLNFGEIDLSKIDVQYRNDVSAFYTTMKVGKLFTQGKNFDLQNRKLDLSELQLSNTHAAIRMGNKEQAKVVAQEVKKEIQTQKEQNWGIRIDKIQFDNDHIEFDNDAQPKTPYGMDYAHFDGDSINLHINDFVMNDDSVGAVITKGSFKEQSGFELDALEGELLYAYNQTYLKNLLIKTPGTELKREVLLHYSSYAALTDSFQNTQIEADIPDSYIQVKDILTFAPQLRSQPAFANPNDVWHINVQANGNMQRLHIAALQFDGFKDTRIDASGTLASFTNPNQAGGLLTIRRLHTSKADIAMLTGQNLSALPVNLPNSFDVRGTVAGGMNNLNTKLNIASSAGDLSLDGQFANLSKPASATYNATLSTNGLAIGSILQNPQMGSVSATVTASGTGFTPEAMNTQLKGSIYSFNFNNYTYRNIAFNGNLKGQSFTAHVNSKDPNAYMNINASGNLATTSSFKVNGIIDSLKTLPLHLTTQPLSIHGEIDADIPSFNSDYLEANVLITKALFVSGTDRLPLDTLQLIAGRSDSGQYINLTSDILNARLNGQYRLADLGSIFQDNIQPYFSTTAYKAAPNVQPYDLSFTASLVYSPILSRFVPGLKNAENVYATGHLATGQGMQATVTSPLIVFSNNEITNLNVQVNTAANGLNIEGTINRLKSGNALDLFNTRLKATVANNNVDFNLRVGDKNDKDRYLISGLFSQPTPGDMRLSLKPDSLLLNYERWTIAPNNAILITSDNVIANNFILQKGEQQLALQSNGNGSGAPLNVGFTNFRLGTITGFVRSDSLLVDGTMNGNLVLRNLMQQPVFTSDLTISNLSFKTDTVGNLRLLVSSAGNSYNTNLTLTGNGNDIALTGSFAPQGSSDLALDLNLAVRKLQLKTLQGALSGFVTQASGAITGNVAINGTTTQPKVRGALSFDTASISTTVLGGPLTINNEKLEVSENGFTFTDFAIRDSANNALTINGNVETSNFINYGFNLDIDADHFKAVNSTKKDNKIFYGQLVISTNLHIGGTEVKPIVDGSLTVNDGTNFSLVIPQAEPGVVSREGVVQFIDFDAPELDSLFMSAYDSLNTAGIIGFDILTNITIQKEAIFNVIVDAANGDFLNLRGTGQLSAGIDPSGKISLTGSYVIEEGAYQLSFNFLQRKFIIDKGSKIVWMGDPTSAEIDVTATYIVNTAPIDLVESSINDPAERNYFLQKLPFHVILKLSGELLKPLISFDITLPTERNYNVANSVVLPTVNNELNRLRQQPTELNKQIFAVLLLNRFVGENPFESSAGGFNARTFARQSVSKLLTEQLNNLAAGLVNGIDINFDVASSNDYSTGSRRSRTDLNVGLSKRLLNDRLTVTVGSNFQLEGPQQVNQSSNNIAGNVSVNYQLSKDGRYMVRFYRKNDYEGTVDGYVIETGLGFIMTVDYNRFREILHAKKIRKQREERLKQIQQQQQ